ncbi:hypothetical protein [Mycobacteroides abscessus]|uniref:hypothetical protein n=1 Tax=Mycobacteroides abscessus TaxID=36809 RepID=UPI000D9A4404|nr:hypothetical protein [Mycobacteroides abscessus]SPX82478.1 phage integrase family protein [Mycobacteroides abscessus]
MSTPQSGLADNLDQLLPSLAEYVLPERLTLDADSRGPLIQDDIWDLRCVVPRTCTTWRLDFTQIPDPVTRCTAKEYITSRLHRGSLGLGPLKATNAANELRSLIVAVNGLQAAGAYRLADVENAHLTRALAEWKHQSQHSAVGIVTTIKHLAAHGPFLTQDRLCILPWNGRSASSVVGLQRVKGENTTPRIPEEVMSPFLRAAVFYVQTASSDLLAAQHEIAELKKPRKEGRSGAGQARKRVLAFVAERRATGRGIPALPIEQAHTAPNAAIIDGVVQAPNYQLVWMLAGCGRANHLKALVQDAANELGYEVGGLDTPMAPWPQSSQPWRPRLGPFTLANELSFLRTACWIVIAYLSGMRDAEVRELRRDCAFTATGLDGRIRYKIRGKVYKSNRRPLDGEEADWVVLEIVHQAIAVLCEINDAPDHLFGYHGKGVHGHDHALLWNMHLRLNTFRDHLDELFGGPAGPYIPRTAPAISGSDLFDDNDGESADTLEEAATNPASLPADELIRWPFTPRQFRRTLAWHIAHQPFGVVAGARQYKHAAITMFEGYAGASASGFADEVAAEQATAKLDYVEDLYHDWNDGGSSVGGASTRVDAEFERIRNELGDLPGVVANPRRLRTLLKHLTKTLHPGVLNDCFYQPDSAVCRDRAQHVGKPVPMLDTCMRCPNARRSSVHAPRLALALASAQDELGNTDGLPPLQKIAINEHLATLKRLVTEIRSATPS